MNPLLIPFLTYSFVTIFTPGPANVSASALGKRVGYRRSVPYLLGIGLGLLLLLTAAGLLTGFFERNYARMSSFLRWVGAAYIAWLAVSLFLPEHTSTSRASTSWGFASGFLLELLNPKGILFAITTFTSFSTLLTGSPLMIIGSACFLAFLAFSATSLWALLGATLSRFFKDKTFSTVFNCVMALLLLFSAYSIVTH